MSDDDLVEAAREAIVVGVDDSEGARAALAFALEEAARRALPILAVSVFRSQSPWQPQIAYVIDEDRVVGEMKPAAQRFVDDVVATQRERGVDVTDVKVAIRTGRPADVLVRISRHSALLVLGQHRSSAHQPGRVTGSVGPGVIKHAECPVTVVPPRPAID